MGRQGTEGEADGSVAMDDPGTLAYRDEEDPLLGAKRERKFLLKLDACLMTWAWLAYLIKQIDSSNYKTAYASGMKEDMGFVGNQLNYLDTMFRIGYAVFLIPSQLILTSVRPKFWLPPLELAWGVLTGLMAVSSTIEGMYALRFFIGVFEASSYPGIVTILCNWYTPSELATRVAIFSSSYPAASMFVSFMQVAIQETLDGAHGIAGWRWLFIFNAIMTVVVATMGFLLIPDAPGMAKVFWMSGEDDRISRWRVDRVNKRPPTKLSWAAVKRTFKGWQLWIFTFSYAFWGWATNSNTWIILFLKDVKNPDGSLRFTVSEINAIPIGGYALQLIAMLVFAWLSSRTGKRARWIVIQMVITLVGCIILSAWPASFGLKMFGYFLLWVNNAAGPILIAWMADWCPSPEERNIIVGVAVTIVYAIDSFANVLIYPASEAPNYRVGYKAAAAFSVACLIFTGLFKYKDSILRKAISAQDRLHHQRELDGSSASVPDMEDPGRIGADERKDK